MNKIKLIITNCKSKINSLLDRVRGSEITHIIVTNNGNKIKCYESIELYSDEIKIIVAKCIVNMKQYMITINDDKIDYILEEYDNEIWEQILNISNSNNVVENIDENSIYR